MEQIRMGDNLFKNIFPDYDLFSSWYRGSPLCDGFEDVPSIKTFTLIANEFNDSHASMSVESFKEHFSNDLYTYYREFEETTKSIIDLMNLKEKDIAIDDYMITNMANIPETKMSTDEETVDYISQQNKMINKKGRLRISKELLASKRAFTTKTFLNRFRHLFRKVIAPAYTYVAMESTGE